MNILKSKKIYFFCALSLFVSIAVLLAAAESYEGYIGQVISIRFAAAKKVFIRKPDIVDVVKVTPGKVDLLCKQAGFTSVEIQGIGRIKRVIEITVLDEDLDSLKEKVSDLIHKKLGLEGVVIKRDSLNSKLILEGKVSQLDLENVNKLTEKYAVNITNFLTLKEEKDLVQIDAHILELGKNWTRDLGIDWTGFSSIQLSENTTGAAASTGGSLKDVFRIADWTRNSFSATFKLWETSGVANVLAKPKLVCLSGKEASFLVGGELPILTYQEGTPTVEYKEYGVKLIITPVLREGGIFLGVKTEVSEIDEANKLDVVALFTDSGSVSYEIPAFTTRETETQLFLKDGQTLFISGILKDNVTRNVDQYPGLANIPILGELFKSKGYQDDKTELVITLTPTVIRQGLDRREAKKLIDSYKPLVKKDEQVSLAMANYIKMVQERINYALSYPILAREAGWQGKLKLSLHISAQGNLLAARIAESSGYKVFDDAVLKVAKEIGSYPPFPSSIDEKELWIDMPVVYKLD